MSDDRSVLRVELLGPVRAWLGDREVDLGPARRRALFAMLALRAGEVVSREELVDGLWGENPPAKAVGILYTYVSALRRAVDPAVLISPGSGYLLRVDPEHVDDREFTRLCDTAQHLRESGEVAAALAALDTALSRCRGPVLSGVSSPFLDLHRARLTEAVLSARERRAELQLLLGQDAEVITGMTAFVAEQPLREGARALLMTALHRSGRSAEAIEVYRAAERELAADLGLEPTPVLRQLREKIDNGAVVTVGDLRARPSAPSQRPDTPCARELPDPPAPPAVCVGRDRELALMRSMLAGLSHGRGGCALVEGEPGSGRTALAATVLAAADAAGHRTIWLTGHHVLRPERNDADPDPSGFAEVDRLADQVTRVCAESPLVVVLDDLHEADSTGRLAWRQLSRLTLRLPLVLVGCARTAARDPEIDQVRGAVNVAGGRILEIGPLDADAAHELTAAVVGASPGTALVRLVAAAGGSPRALRELLDAADRAGLIRVEDGVAELAPGAADRLADVLARVADRRLAPVSAVTRAVLRTAALFGDEFELADLATVAGAPPSDLVGAVAEATAAGMLVDTGGGLGFRDATMREFLRAEIPAAERDARHRAAAEALADSGAPVPLVAAQLLAMTTRFDAWVARWLLANADAVAAQNPVAAADLLERAATAPVTENVRDALRVLRVRWMFRVGRHPIDDARAALAAAVDPGEAAALSWILAHLVYRTGDADGAIRTLLDVEESDSAPKLWQVRCQALRAQFERTGLRDLDRAQQTARAALTAATSMFDRSAMAQARQVLWHAETVRRDHLAAFEHIDRAVADAGAVGHLGRWTLDLLDNRVLTLQHLNRLPEAAQTLARMRDLSERVRPVSGRVPVVTAVHLYWLGRWDEALTELGLVTEGQFAGPAELRLQTPLLEHGVAALIAARRGDWATVQDRLRRADTVAPTIAGYQDNTDLLVMARALDAARRSGPAAAAEAMDVLLDFGYGQLIPRHLWMPALVRFAQAAGDGERVAAALTVCETEAAKEIPAARAATALRWCTALAEHDPAAMLDVVRHHGELGRHVEMAEALADAAVLLAEQGELDRAERACDDALAVFGGLRASVDGSGLRTRLAAYGIHRPDTSAGQPNLLGWQLLSEAEREVAGLVAAGNSNADVSARLAIARREVQYHLSSALRKLGFDSRAELAEKVTAAR